jgi:hypothetical protein
MPRGGRRWGWSAHKATTCHHAGLVSRSSGNSGAASVFFVFLSKGSLSLARRLPVFKQLTNGAELGCCAPHFY